MFQQWSVPMINHHHCDDKIENLSSQLPGCDTSIGEREPEGGRTVKLHIENCMMMMMIMMMMMMMMMIKMMTMIMIMIMMKKMMT